MTNFKLSSKLNLFIIISVVLAVIGVAVGVICHFVADGYFNYGAEFKSYNTVEVNYAYVDYSDENTVKELCDGVFEKNGISYYNSVSGDTDDGGKIVFKFSKSVEVEKLSAAVTGITEAFSAGSQSNVSYHVLETKLNGSKVLIFASIALASAIVLQFLYYLVRFKVTMAFAALLANIHNLAIYVSLITIWRIPVGTSAVAFGVLTVILTIISSGFLFDRYRRNLKKEDFTKLDAHSQTNQCVAESYKNILYPTVGVACAALIIFAMLSISALSASAVVSPVVAALYCVASVLYGSLFIAPVYTRIKLLGDNLKARSKNKK